MKGRHRKVLLVLALCSVVGLMLGMSPAFAHAPTTNQVDVFPNDNDTDGQTGFGAGHGPDGGGEDSESKVSSDVLDTGANFSGITDPSATAYGWIGCADAGNPTTSTPGGACDVFGVDTSGKAGQMPVGFPQGHYWRMQMKIPVDYEGGPFDLYGAACASDGNPATQPTDTNHCVLETAGNLGGNTCSPPGSNCLDDMHFDHTAITTDHGATSGGRIESVQAGSTTCGTIEAHGCALPNLQALTITAVSGPAPNSADGMGFCLENEAVFGNNNDDPDPSVAPPVAGNCDVFAFDGGPAAGPGGTDLWSVTIPAVQLASDSVWYIAITEHDDGSATDSIVESGKGDCRGDVFSTTGDDCQFDAVQVMFNPTGQGGGPPAPPGPPVPPTPPAPPGGGGGGGCNRIVGNARDNVLNGTAVCDNINGKAGDDLMRGKKGNDKIRGGGGTDIAKGGGGNDNCTAERERSC